MADPFRINMTFSGFNRVRNQLRATASYHTRITDPIIEKHTKREALGLRQKPYPPPKSPNPKYIRTFTLKRSFRAQRRGLGRWAIINRASRFGREYAVWVIKKGMQNRQWHFKWWWTIDDVLDKSKKFLTRDLTTALEVELNRQSD